MRAPSAASGCTAQLTRFSTRLLAALRCEEGVDTRVVASRVGALDATSPLERALSDAVLRALGRSLEAGLRTVRQFVETVTVEAPKVIAVACAEHCLSKGVTSVAVVSGSSLALDAVKTVAADAKFVAVIDVAQESNVGKNCAVTLSEMPVLVRYAPLAAAHDALSGVDVLFVGAHEVAMNGAIVVAAGVSAVVSLANVANVAVVVVAQMAKFTDAPIVAHIVGDRDVLKASEVDVIVTEGGGVVPYMAPDVLKRTGNA